jgi:uncharacterized protein (TIGR00369 family)
VGDDAPPPGFSEAPDQGPFLEGVGPLLMSDADGETVFGLRAEERHANRGGAVMGGMLATFADYALGRAIEADADDDHTRATVSLTVDYLAPANPGDWIESRASVDRVGGALAFADCSLTVEGREVVRARAVFARVD